MFVLKNLGGALLQGVDGPVRGKAGHRRRIALLAVLTSARGRPVAREKLIGLLWPEHPADAARRLLSESLYVLRKALGEDTFSSVGDEVALDSRVVTSDANGFEEAVEAGDPSRAVALYKGPFLEGFYLSEAAEFERWVEGERDRLDRMYAQVLEDLADAAEGRGEFLEAAGWWRRLAGHDSYSSRLVLRLMGALEKGGEHMAALRAASEHADFLRTELGALPDPAVPAYAERLRTAPPTGRIPAVPEPVELVQQDPLLSEPRVTDESDLEPPQVLPEADEPGQLEPDHRDPPGVSRVAPPSRIARNRLLRLAAATAGTALLLIVVVWFRQTQPSRAASQPTSSAFDPRRVAVLYFDDHSANRDLGHIANGLTEGLIHELAQVSALHVISRNGVKPYRAGNTPLDSIVRALRIGTLVEGSIQRSGDRLRVTVQLVDTHTGAHLQSRTLERPIGELFALEDELAREVSDFLRRRLGQEIRLRERSAGTKSTVAREAVFRAEQLREEAARLATGPTPLDTETRREMLVRADSLLAEASRADRRWAEPWVLRGWTTLAAGESTQGAQLQAYFATALRYVNEALKLAPGSAAALELRGTTRWRMVQRGIIQDSAAARTMTQAAERDLNGALAQDASLARAWATLSQLLRVQEGRLAESEVAARRALETDEFLEEAPLVMERLYRSSVQLARFDSAAAWCTRGRERFPADLRFVECRLTLLGYAGPEPPNVELAWRLTTELEQMDPPGKSLPYTSTYRRMAVARVAARAGLADSARAISLAAREEVRGNRELEGAQAGDEAYVRLLLGERDSAIVLLERQLNALPRLRTQVAREVKFRALHDDPRFQRLVREAPSGTP